MQKNRTNRIDECLSQHLSIQFIEILDESHRHHVPKDAETHFKLIIVSETFDGLSLVKRHQLINNLLKNEFASGMHALSIHAYTANEWLKKTIKPPKSPHCRDGFGK